MKRIALASVRMYDKTQRDFLFLIMCVHATKILPNPKDTPCIKNSKFTFLGVPVRSALQCNTIVFDSL